MLSLTGWFVTSSALYFHRVDYVLVNVTVTGSAGCGLLAFQCGEQITESAAVWSTVTAQ